MNSPTMIVAVLAASLGAAAPAAAQIAVSANDAKMTVVDGVNTPILKPPPDSVSVIDFSGGTPRITHRRRSRPVATLYHPQDPRI